MCWHCRVGFLRKEKNGVKKDTKCAGLLKKEENEVRKNKKVCWDFRDGLFRKEENEVRKNKKFVGIIG